MFAVLILTMAQPPKIEVVNLCPPKIEVVNLCPARSVPVTTFRGIKYNPTHRCQECGRSQFAIAGPGPIPGTHIHRDTAGHQWYH